MPDGGDAVREALHGFLNSAPHRFGQSEAPLTLAPVGGGRSNPTYFVRWGEHEYVLRHPPTAVHGAAAHDIEREYRVLTALADTPVPAPTPVAYCADAEVIGVPFYLMRRVHGRVVTLAADAPDLGEPGRAARLGEAMIDALLAIHDVDPVLAGLGDPARGAGYVRRQAERWHRQWTAQQQRSIPEYDEVGRRLVEIGRASCRERV